MMKVDSHVCPSFARILKDGANQKLRFTMAQLRHLEDAFARLQRPNAHQKAALATELGIQPRQVEVWFQNRRARGKAKRTETNCEVLRQRCHDLIVENQQLNYLIQTESVGLDSHDLMGNGESPLQLQLALCNSCKKAPS